MCAESGCLQMSAVVMCRQWSKVALEWKPDLPKSTSTSTAMKKHYKQLLLAFEHKVSAGCPQETVQASCSWAAARGCNNAKHLPLGSCMRPTAAALQDTLWLPGSCRCLLMGTLHGLGGLLPSQTKMNKQCPQLLGGLLSSQNKLNRQCPRCRWHVRRRRLARLTPRTLRLSASASWPLGRCLSRGWQAT